MISIAILFIFLSFYMFYNTSKRAVKHIGFGFEKKLSDYNEQTKIGGAFFCICSLILFIISFGLGSGFLLFFIVLMTSGSLIVLLTPLRFITYINTLLFFLVSIFVEYFVI
tara:strand:+ start:3619 stop:3951 length:333 start_codon:yes stop_codon:yes gene_type:complete